MTKKSQKKFRFGFWLVLTFISILYIGFMSYYCKAEACSLNEIAIENEKCSNDANLLNAQEDSGKDQRSHKPIGKNANDANNLPPKMVGFTYLSEITAFYERVITILSVIIGIVLVISFVYVHLTSKQQADDMARDALYADPFKDTLELFMSKKFTDFKNSEELMSIYSEIPDLMERLERIEKIIDVDSYELFDETEVEGDNGNNKT